MLDGLSGADGPIEGCRNAIAEMEAVEITSRIVI
jgi:hypothetical protein